MEPGAPIAPDRLSEFDHYLTARFRLWSINRRLTLTTGVDHRPWPLRRAEVVALRQDILERAGLPSPLEAPLVHYSEGVDVRIARPEIRRR